MVLDELRVEEMYEAALAERAEQARALRRLANGVIAAAEDSLKRFLNHRAGVERALKSLSLAAAVLNEAIRRTPDGAYAFGVAELIPNEDAARLRDTLVRIRENLGEQEVELPRAELDDVLADLARVLPVIADGMPPAFVAAARAAATRLGEELAVLRAVDKAEAAARSAERRRRRAQDRLLRRALKAAARARAGLARRTRRRAEIAGMAAMCAPVAACIASAAALYPRIDRAGAVSAAAILVPLVVLSLVCARLASRLAALADAAQREADDLRNLAAHPDVLDAEQRARAVELLGVDRALDSLVASEVPARRWARLRPQRAPA